MEKITYTIRQCHYCENYFGKTKKPRKNTLKFVWQKKGLSIPLKMER